MNVKVNSKFIQRYVSLFRKGKLNENTLRKKNLVASEIGRLKIDES